MNLEKEVVILLATYNGEKYISHQIDSILRQTHTNWKIIIHDDKSTDKTVDLLETYANKYPDKIQFVNDKIGFGNSLKNFSFLLDQADAEFIMFCDQDDVWHEDKIERSLVKMKEAQALEPGLPLLVHTDLCVVNAELEVLDESYVSYQHFDPSKNTLNRLLLQNVVTGCTVMINKELANLCLDMPEEAIAHDWWIALVASCFGRIVYLDEPTMLYRQHANNQVGAQDFNFKEIFTKARNLSTISLNKYFTQANALRNRYRNELTVQELKLLDDFINIQGQAWIRTKYTLVKHRFLKQGIQRNIGLLFCK